MPGDRIEAEWTAAVLTSSTATVHLSFDWIRQLWLHFFQTAPVTILIARDRDGIAGFIPLLSERRRWGILSAPTVRLLGNKLSPRSDIVILRREVVVAAALWREVQKLQWWYLDIGRVPVTSPGLAQFTGPQARRLGWVRNRRNYDNVVVTTDNGWETFLRSKSHNFRRSVQRYRRAANHLTSKAFPEGGMSFDAILDDIRHVMWRSWQGAAADPELYSDLAWRFHRGILGTAAAAGLCRITCLYEADKPVAFSTGVVFKQTCYGLKTGYDPAVASLSPGFLSMARFVESTFEAAITRVDFDPITTGSEYKLRWATKIEPLASYYLFRHRAVPAAIVAAYDWKHRGKGRAGRGQQAASREAR
jgi:CelD/BcsL family acetyltransferase involved in cellulose biosynthesis